MMIDSSTVGTLLRIKRDLHAGQKVVFLGSIPTIVDKTIFDKIITKLTSWVKA